MMHARRIIRPLVLLGCTALVAVGCGGGDEVAPAPDPGVATPAPGVTDTTGLVGGAAPAPAPAASTKLPDLKGGDVNGKGIGGGGGGMFDALAVSPQTLLDTEVVPDMSTTTPAAAMPTTPTMPTTPAPTVAAPTFTGAAIYVDGTVYNVQKGDSFPNDEPIFKLVGVSPASIELELVAGEFTSGGGDGVFLDKGDLVSLVNASEQVTYKVKFLRATEGAVSGIGL